MSDLDTKVAELEQELDEARVKIELISERIHLPGFVASSEGSSKVPPVKDPDIAVLQKQLTSLEEKVQRISFPPNLPYTFYRSSGNACISVFPKGYTGMTVGSKECFSTVSYGVYNEGQAYADYREILKIRGIAETPTTEPLIHHNLSSGYFAIVNSPRSTFRTGWFNSVEELLNGIELDIKRIFPNETNCDIIFMSSAKAPYFWQGNPMRRTPY